MGKLATTGGRVTRDNEEREASVWSVERSGASSGRAFAAVSTARIVRTIHATEPNRFTRSPCQFHYDASKRRRRRGESADSRIEIEIETENANAIDRIQKIEEEEEEEGEEEEETKFAFSFEKRTRHSGISVDRRSIGRGGYREYRSGQFRFGRSGGGGCGGCGGGGVGGVGGVGLIILLGLAALCAPALAVPMPSRANSLARTGLRYNLDRTTGLEDVYEDAFENAFQEEDRPTTRTVLDDTELDIIRRSIARGLGLKRIPDPSKANVSQAEYERAHREYLSKVQPSSDERGFSGNTRLHVFYVTEYPGNGSSRSWNERSDRDRRRHHRRHSHRLFFPVEIPGWNDVASVDHATLRLLLHGPIDDRYEDPAGTDPEKPGVDALLYLRLSRSRRMLVRKRIEPRDWRDSRWLEFDSTLAVSSWLEAALENFGLELEFVRDGEPIERAFSSPVLNVFTTPGDSRARTKRSTPEEVMPLHKGRRTKCKGDGKKCCRHELTVMFKDLKGFEFIVYPKTFDAGYCKGRCPPRYNPAHHHALLQSLLWKEDRKKVPKPCCAPSKLDQLMIVYFDENDSTQLKVSYWQNIQVLECACS